MTPQDLLNFVTNLQAGISLHHIDVLREINRGAIKLEDGFNKLSNLLFMVETEMSAFLKQVNVTIQEQTRLALEAAQAAAGKPVQNEDPNNVVAEEASQ